MFQHLQAYLKVKFLGTFRRHWKIPTFAQAAAAAVADARFFGRGGLRQCRWVLPLLVLVLALFVSFTPPLSLGGPQYSTLLGEALGNASEFQRLRFYPLYFGSLAKKIHATGEILSLLPHFGFWPIIPHYLSNPISNCLASTYKLRQ